jgi:CRP/FNR family transcriptional regulator, cyclic AMP receptor protein
MDPFKKGKRWREEMITTEVLAEIGLFEGLTDEHLGMIASFSEEVFYPAETVIFQEGEEAKNLFLVMEGSIALQLQLTSRPVHITVGIVNQPNESLGWSGVIAPFHYTATARCQADSRMLVIDGSKLMRLLEGAPEVGFGVVCRIAEIISLRLRSSRTALLKTL